MARAKQGKEPKDKGTSLLEWISAVIGGAIAAALVAFIALEALQTNDSAPPVLKVTPESIAAAEGLYVVEMEVANLSSQTAAAVAIEGTLKQNGQTVETSTATLTFVPGKSERRAGLIFTRDPRRFQFDARATGYEEP